MPLIQPQILGLTNNSEVDDTQVAALAGKACELVCAGLHGKYFTQCARGNVFIGSTAAAGKALPAYSATGQNFGLFNPAGSGKLLVPIKIQIGLVTVATETGCTAWGYTLSTQTRPAIASPIAAITAVTPINARLDSGNQSVALFGPGTATLTAAGLFLKTLGIQRFEAATPAAANNYWQLTEYYDGELIIGPGAILLACSNTNLTATYDITLVWEEVPI